ncbi:hypothetical protein P7C73_g595, partial [Tremellales sp. Uapishka_1]
MPPPTLKRPRHSNPVPAAASSGPPRAKRRKPEDVTSELGTGERDKSGKPVPFGVGMVKGREEEWGEPADIKTKINFLDLPVETLYRYLENHDLLPRWDVSPWSEEPCTPPTALYAIPPPLPVVPIHPSPRPETSPTLPLSPTSNPMEIDPVPAAPPQAIPGDAPLAAEAESAVPVPSKTDPPTELSSPKEGEQSGNREETPAPPTTRSRTAPNRRPPTPSPPPPAQIKRGVMTLADVYVAHAVLAEKANVHWVKGLGGGQNKESETIVNFLYKNKVGHGRLLRVYNPSPATYP